MMGDSTIQRELIRKEDDSCSHYCRSTEISRLSHFRFTLPEINFVISILIINSDTSLFQILYCTKIEKEVKLKSGACDRTITNTWHWTQCQDDIKWNGYVLIIKEEILSEIYKSSSWKEKYQVRRICAHHKRRTRTQWAPATALIGAQQASKALLRLTTIDSSSFIIGAAILWHF